MTRLAAVLITLLFLIAFLFIVVTAWTALRPGLLDLLSPFLARP